MIPGVGGDLLSSTFLHEQVSSAGIVWAPGPWMRSVVHWWRRAASTLGPASGPRAVFDVGARPLLALLGLSLAHVERQAWGHAAVVAHEDRPVATLACTPWGFPVSAAWRQSLVGALAGPLRWALVFTGPALAVVDAARPWARRMLVFDLALASRDPRALHALYTFAAGGALAGGADGRLGRAVAASDAEGVAVCASLGRGVLDALGTLVSALDRPQPRSMQARPAAGRLVFDQSLTLVYRLLFLLFAEARRLVPVWHDVYRNAYSVGALCDRVLHEPRTEGVWAAVQAISRLAHAGCDAGDLHVTAFNGRLFAAARAPLVERTRVPDAAVAAALIALGTRATRRGRCRIAFHDLGVEQLGSVYERVLDYEPVRRGRTLTLQPTSAARKATGSFYTPRSITEFLVRRTLAPLVEGRSADDLLALRVLDPAMGSGTFLVAACRYLADRVEQARIADGTWREGEVRDVDRAGFARLVAERCLFGIDRNPAAVQLARVSLWLTTLAEGRPLTFLDHHLAAGNSLIGARLADLPFPPSRSRASRAAPRQPGLFDDDARMAWGRAVVPERVRLARDASDTAGDVRTKERRFERLLGPDGVHGRWVRAADLWCGLALQPGPTPPGLYADLQRHLDGGATALPARDLAAQAGAAAALARRHDAVHWELLFPEVFFDEAGEPRADAGFDAVLGNPPWDVMRADAGDPADRAGARDDAAAVMRFLRTSGHYPLHGSGHVNHYQLFLERAIQALRPGGRFGMIVPAGLQSDVGSAALRRALFDRCGIDTWLGFDNRRAIFPVHRSIRFLLLAGTAGPSTGAVRTASGLTSVDDLAGLPDDPRAADTSGGITVTRAFLERWDPAHFSVPWFTTNLDAAIAARALQAPPLADEAGWGVVFGRELNASDDRDAFVPAGTGAPVRSPLPVIEGKHVRPFAVDVARASHLIARDAALRRLGDAGWARARVCYRDVASATNRLTLIAALLPAGVVSTHTLFCAKRPLAEADAWCLVALLNSLVANALVRLQMSTHVTAALMARLRVPRPSQGSADHRALARAARTLSVCAVLEDDVEAYAAINSMAARLYGLSREEYRHVVSSFPLLDERLRQRCLES